MAERLFEPLGMVDTGFSVPAGEARPAAGLLLAQLRDRRVRAVRRRPGAASRFARPPGFASASGGLVSTADDYLAFARMMLNGGEHRGPAVLSAAVGRRR